MSEVKWIKIVTDIFNNKKIRLIESMPEGDAVIVIWFKLLMLAGNINENGNVFFTRDIPYTEQMLATVFNRPVSTVQLALNTFVKFHMIDIFDDIIHVSNWEKYQNVEGMERIRKQTRDRVARYRENKRLEMGSQMCSYCGERATGYDHIIATARGGSDEDYNKTPCCKRCNQIKNDKPLVDFLNNNRDIIKDDLIAKNSKLTRYVTLHNVTNRYIVTGGNAIDIDIDKEKDINILSSKVEDVIAYLNEKTGKSFKSSTASTKKHISGRLNEGYTLEDFKRVIDIKCEQWLKDSKMSKYLRPDTLFSPGHFESYLNEAPKPKPVAKNEKQTEKIDLEWQRQFYDDEDEWNQQVEEWRKQGLV